MKKLLFVCTMTLVWGFGIMLSEANAQGGIIYGGSLTTLNNSAHNVEGYSISYLNYIAALYYDPAVQGDLYRTDNLETFLDSDYDVGYADIIDAEVFLFTTNYVGGKTYCTGGQHFIVNYSTGVRTYKGSSINCKTIPFPSTPTPTQTPTATPTPAITPTPSPTPCPPGIDAVCQETIISVHISPEILKPVDTIGGNNTATVSGCLMNGNTPVTNQQIYLKVYRHLADMNTGGHIESYHPGNRPIGRIEKTSGMTGSDGCFTSKYKPSHIAGVVTIEAYRSANFYEFKPLFVGVPNLIELPAGENYNLTGTTNSHPSPVNHWGKQAAVDGLIETADDYKTMFYGSNQIPQNSKLAYNDMSLPMGGKFDLHHKWENGTSQHGEHREGINDDVGCCAVLGYVPTNRWVALNRIFFDRGSTLTNDETDNPVGPHWHLRFLFGAPNVLAERTPHSFVENSWEATMDRFATQEEWENWHTQIVEAKAQGTSQLLEKAKFFQQSLISKSEYVARHRTDAEFVGDVFWSHFFRDTTAAESLYWQEYLQNRPPIETQARKRRNLLYQIEATTEFETTILGIVD